MKTKIFIYFLVCKRTSNDNTEGARGTVFQDIRPGAVFKTVHFVREMLVGLP